MKLQRFKLGFTGLVFSLPICATAEEKWIEVLHLAADLHVRLFGCNVGKTAK